MGIWHGRMSRNPCRQTDVINRNQKLHSLITKRGIPVSDPLQIKLIVAVACPTERILHKWQKDCFLGLALEANSIKLQLQLQNIIRDLTRCSRLITTITIGAIVCPLKKRKIPMQRRKTHLLSVQRTHHSRRMHESSWQMHLRVKQSVTAIT